MAGMAGFLTYILQPNISYIQTLLTDKHILQPNISYRQIYLADKHILQPNTSHSKKYLTDKHILQTTYLTDKHILLPTQNKSRQVLCFDVRFDFEALTTYLAPLRLCRRHERDDGVFRGSDFIECARRSAARALIDDYGLALRRRPASLISANDSDSLQVRC